MRQTGSEYLIELKFIYRNVILKSLLYSHMPSSVYIFIHAIYTFLYMPPTLYHLHLLHARISLRPWHDQQVEHLAPLLLPFRLPLPTCSTACTWSISQKLSAQISNNKYQKQKKEKERNKKTMRNTYSGQFLLKSNDSDDDDDDWGTLAFAAGFV